MSPFATNFPFKYFNKPNIHSCTANAMMMAPPVLVLLALATLCHAVPITILSDDDAGGGNAVLSAAQMMVDCCFVNGNVSLCDVMIGGSNYCLADGKPPAKQAGCIYRTDAPWRTPLYLVRCDAKG